MLECLNARSTALERAERRGGKASPASIAPERIVRTLPIISQTLLRGRQEDAHEFLGKLVSG